MQTRTKKVIAREFLILTIALVLICFAFITISIYRKYENNEIEDIASENSQISSMIIDYENYNELLKLHSEMKSDEVFSQVTPIDFHNFKNEYSKLAKLTLLHSALISDDVFVRKVPRDFSLAMKNYDIVNHFLFKGYLKENGIVKRKNDLTYSDLDELLIRNEFKKKYLTESILTNENEKEIMQLTAIIIFSVLFILRYFVYALFWSLNVLKLKN